MKLKPENVSVEMSRGEALDVIRVLHRGIDVGGPEPKGAINLLNLLRGNFEATTKGVNYP